MALALCEDFRDIVLHERPLLDVRAPVEFAKGAFPNAVNIPIMTDQERHLIGIRYKNNGNEAAVALGQELIDGTPRQERTQAWKDFIQAHPNAYLYCFRGGQRSRIAQEWLADESIMISCLKGGYKAFRNYLIEESTRIAQSVSTLIIGGRTGSGKTLLLKKLPNSIDLEGLANHRGSSFGRFTTPQPTQIDFENALAYALIQHEAQEYKHLIIEHEGRQIGRINIPKPIFAPLQSNSALIILETPLRQRVDITYTEYVSEALRLYHDRFGDVGKVRWFDDAIAGLERIQKRLGSQRHQRIKRLFEEAYHDDILGAHKEWIEILLKEYYDPMYDYQIEKSTIPILFRGDEKEVLAYLASQ